MHTRSQAHTHTQTQVILSFFGLISALGVAGVFLVQDQLVNDVVHCDYTEGLLIAVKFRGPMANLDALGDYQGQVPLRLKLIALASFI